MANLSYGVSGSSYFDLCRKGQVFCAYAIVTAPVIYSTAAGTGGPILWNNTPDKTAVILGMTFGSAVVTTVAAAIGLTGNTGSVGGATTAIDTVASLLIGGPASQMTVFRTATPSTAGNFFLPLMDVHTGALTVDTENFGFIPLDGLVCVQPGAWVSIAASATASTLQAKFGLIWAEIAHI